MSTWLVLGTSATAIDGLAASRRDFEIDTTITTNRGILLIPNPTYYFLSDTQACAQYNANAIAAAKNGTRTLTMKRHDVALKARSVDWFDEFLDESPHYEPFRLSGLICLEYAALHGAKTIVVVGHDGYSKDPNIMDYFDAHLGRRTHVTDWSNDIIKPRCQMFCKKYPHVEWVQYGRPEYEVESESWHVRRL